MNEHDPWTPGHEPSWTEPHAPGSHGPLHHPIEPPPHPAADPPGHQDPELPGTLEHPAAGHGAHHAGQPADPGSAPGPRSADGQRTDDPSGAAEAIPPSPSWSDPPPGEGGMASGVTATAFDISVSGPGDARHPIHHEAIHPAELSGELYASLWAYDAHAAGAAALAGDAAVPATPLDLGPLDIEPLRR